jgi:hypothetical protein
LLLEAEDCHGLVIQVTISTINRPNLLLGKMSFDFFAQDPLRPEVMLLDQGPAMQPPFSKFNNSRQHTKARVENDDPSCIPNGPWHAQ